MKESQEQINIRLSAELAARVAPVSKADAIRAKHMQELKDRPRTMGLRAMANAQAAEAAEMRADIRQAAHDRNVATASVDELTRIRELNLSMATMVVISNNVIGGFTSWNVTKRMVHTERVAQSRPLRKAYATGNATREESLRLADHIAYMAARTDWFSPYYFRPQHGIDLNNRMRFIPKLDRR